MDVGILNLVTAGIAGLVAWNTIIERKLVQMRSQMHEKIEDVQKINEVVQEQLEKTVERLENKIDFLVQLAISNNNTPSK